MNTGINDGSIILILDFSSFNSLRYFLLEVYCGAATDPSWRIKFLDASSVTEKKFAEDTWASIPYILFPAGSVVESSLPSPVI